MAMILGDDTGCSSNIQQDNLLRLHRHSDQDQIPLMRRLESINPYDVQLLQTMEFPSVAERWYCDVMIHQIMVHLSLHSTPNSELMTARSKQYHYVQRS